jgi:hypothetical protein
MKRAALGLASLLVAAGSVHAALVEVPKPPPGSIKGTTVCNVGGRHELSAYRRDQGCLLGNMTLSSMADGGPDAAWAVKTAEATYHLAALASTVASPPEELYLNAVQHDLIALRMGTASAALREKLCAHAATAFESACIAFDCGGTEIQPASPALNEAQKALRDRCQLEPKCRLKDRGLDATACKGPWKQARTEANRALAANDTVHDQPTVYGKSTQAAVRDWTTRALALVTASEKAIVQGSGEVAAMPTFLATNAVPALTAMRSDEVDHATTVAKNMERTYGAVRCVQDRASCELDKKQQLSIAATVGATAEEKAFHLKEVASGTASTEDKLEVLEKPLDLRALGLGEVRERGGRP